VTALDGLQLDGNLLTVGDVGALDFSQPKEQGHTKIDVAK
jgi:hypothetical protein